VGLLLIFKIQQYQIRKEIKHLIKLGVPDNQLVHISISTKNKSQLEWKHSKEFRYKGNMYDVVKIEIVNDSTTLYQCVSDQQETILFANLDEQVKKNMDSKNNGSNPIKNLFKFLSNIYSQSQYLAWVPCQITEELKFKFFDLIVF
jgi:hypothetical protein